MSLTQWPDLRLPPKCSSSRSVPRRASRRKHSATRATVLGRDANDRCSASCQADARQHGKRVVSFIQQVRLEVSYVPACDLQREAPACARADGRQSGRHFLPGQSAAAVDVNAITRRDCRMMRASIDRQEALYLCSAPLRTSYQNNLIHALQYCRNLSWGGFCQYHVPE